jgi:DNA processing protein
VIALGVADARYPRALLDLRDPPDPLWVDGDPGALRPTAVSIVGTRRMTPYGARVARELAAACAEAGIVVVSGLAQGVDSAAHQGALDARGATIAVLGAGLAAYLNEARGRRRLLAHAIRTSAALVSEFPPEAPARKWTFARRDATIAALGVITVVVEAPLGSGALITATEARRLRRPVYAVPGPIGAAASAGANELIASGAARALTGVPMLLDALGRSSPSEAPPRADLEVSILDALAGAPADPDALARRIGISSTELAVRIARLALRGEIAIGADGRLARLR